MVNLYYVDTDNEAIIINDFGKTVKKLCYFKFFFPSDKFHFDLSCGENFYFKNITNVFFNINTVFENKFYLSKYHLDNINKYGNGQLKLIVKNTTIKKQEVKIKFNFYSDI